MRSFRITRGCLVSLAATTVFLLCTAPHANPVEIDTNWTVEMTDEDSSIIFEFTSFGEEDDGISVEWRDGDTWVNLEGTWVKSGTVTASGSGDSWEMDRVARTIPCPAQGDWQYRIVMDRGPEYPLNIPIEETVTCAAAGENADEFYSRAGESIRSCSFVPINSTSSLFSLLWMLLF